jgi:hypothetical protein
MSAQVNYYEKKYEEWFEKHTNTSRWHPLRKHKAKIEYEYYLRMMMDTIQIEKEEFAEYLREREEQGHAAKS